MIDKNAARNEVEDWLFTHGWEYRVDDDAWIYRDSAGGILLPDALLDAVDDPIARVEAMMVERRAKIAQGGEEGVLPTMSKGSFIGQPVMPYVGMNTGVTAPSQPCLDENNSYHPERCDRARCDKPWCKRGEARRQEQSVATMEMGEQVTIRCSRCGRPLSHLSYWQATRAAKAQGWIVADSMRLCPECQP